MEEKILLIESHYLPSIEYFALLSRYSEIHAEVCENFQKQTYRNRCLILGPNRVLKLVVPVRKEPKKMTAVEIDNRQDWLKDHWRSIESAYNNSPFFIYYRDELHDIFRRNHDRLVDLNHDLLTFCLRKLGYNISIERTTIYHKNPDKDIYDDFRGILSAKENWSERNILKPSPYYQLFGKTFVPNLSILDLLFCEGPVSAEIIQRSLNN